MTAISAQMVKKLREKTGAGMIDCKKALVEAEGDFDKAEKILKELGLAAAAKRSGRATNEGRVFTKIDGGKAVIDCFKNTCNWSAISKLSCSWSSRRVRKGMWATLCPSWISAPENGVTLSAVPCSSNVGGRPGWT